MMSSDLSKYTLHSTARLAKCKKCSGEFSALMGLNVIHALSGNGLCRDCYEAALNPPKRKASKTEVKPEPKKDDEQTSSVQD